MTLTTALTHYETQRAIARVLGITEQAVSIWVKDDRVPLKRARELEKDSKGKVTVDPAVYVRVKGETVPAPRRGVRNGA